MSGKPRRSSYRSSDRQEPEGPNALVTGASSGIGRAIALALGHVGPDVSAEADVERPA